MPSAVSSDFVMHPWYYVLVSGSPEDEAAAADSLRGPQKTRHHAAGGRRLRVPGRERGSSALLHGL